MTVLLIAFHLGLRHVGHCVARYAPTLLPTLKPQCFKAASNDVSRRFIVGPRRVARYAPTRVSTLSPLSRPGHVNSHPDVEHFFAYFHGWPGSGVAALPELRCSTASPCRKICRKQQVLLSYPMKIYLHLSIAPY